MTDALCMIAATLAITAPLLMAARLAAPWFAEATEAGAVHTDRASRPTETRP